MNKIALKNPSETPAKLPPLKGKQRLWLRYYLNASNPKTFFNATESAKYAKYNAKNLSQVGAENYRKLKLRIDKWLNEHGLSETQLKGKLLSLVNAKETKLFANKDEKGELEIIEHQIPALETQRRSLDMAFKIKGLYKDNDNSGARPVININFNSGGDPGPIIDVTPGEVENEK